jgi:tetratricopeptide (TPR) repeat protein
VKYCPECGHQLDRGTEKFCPECGEELGQAATSGRYDKKKSSIGITDTKGDVFGAGVGGTGHFIGKELAYTVQGNMINLQISGGVSNEVLQTLQKMISIPTQLDPTISPGREHDNKEIKEKQEAVVEAKQQIGHVLEDINKVSKKEGKEIQEIKAGDLQISTKELLLKEIMLKGDEHWYKKEYYDAISWYDKAIEIDPNYAKAWINKGMSLSKLGKYQEAIEYLDKAIELDPNRYLAWINKGYALYSLGKYEEAIEHFDKAIELDPKYANAWNGKAWLLANTNRNNEALPIAQRSLEIDPKNAAALDTKGFILYNLGKYEEAMKYLDQAIESDPNDYYAWGHKGDALYKLGKYQEAIKHYDKALAFDPNMTLAALPTARKNRDLAYKQLGKKSRWKDRFGGKK